MFFFFLLPSIFILIAHSLQMPMLKFHSINIYTFQEVVLSQLDMKLDVSEIFSWYMIFHNFVSLYKRPSCLRIRVHTSTMKALTRCHYNCYKLEYHAVIFVHYTTVVFFFHSAQKISNIFFCAHHISYYILPNSEYAIYNKKL